MSESKFKVGDKVMIKSTKKQGVITSCTPRYFNTIFVDYMYSIDTATHYSYRETALELVDRTYTGIELLQAIKDGVFKNGDGLEVLYNGKLMDKAKVIKCGSGSTIKYEGGDIHGKVVGIQIIINKYVTFKPIKEEPINIALENESLSMKMSIEILGVMDMIEVDVRYEANKTTVTLASGIKGVAKCCPEDKFNRNKGTRLALSRAIKKQLIKDMDKIIDGYM